MLENGQKIKISRKKVVEKGRLHIMGVRQQFARSKNHEEVHDSKTRTLHVVSNNISLTDCHR